MTTSQVQSQIPEYGQGNSDCSEESVNLVFRWGWSLSIDIWFFSHVSYMFYDTSIKALMWILNSCLNTVTFHMKLKKCQYNMISKINNADLAKSYISGCSCKGFKLLNCSCVIDWNFIRRRCFEIVKGIFWAQMGHWLWFSSFKGVSTLHFNLVLPFMYACTATFLCSLCCIFVLRLCSLCCICVFWPCVLFLRSLHICGL